MGSLLLIVMLWFQALHLVSVAGAEGMLSLSSAACPLELGGISLARAHSKRKSTCTKAVQCHAAEKRTIPRKMEAQAPLLECSVHLLRILAIQTPLQRGN